MRLPFIFLFAYRRKHNTVVVIDQGGEEKQGDNYPAAGTRAGAVFILHWEDRG